MTHKRFIIAICLLAASGVLAQTANVIELSPTDAARAKMAWDTLQKAQAEWDSIQKDIDLTYVPVGVLGHCTSVNGRCVVDEWSHGIEFSKSFKSIVPKPGTWTTSGTVITVPTYPTYPYWTCPPCTGTGCITYH